MFSINCLEITVPKEVWDNPEFKSKNQSIYKNLLSDDDYKEFDSDNPSHESFRKRFFFNDFYKKEQHGNLVINQKKSLPDNFFGDNINVQAIVGKNGSGKSSLMDLMYMAINNFCYMFDRNRIRPNSANLFFVKNLYVNLYFSINQQEYLLENQSDDVGLYFWNNNTKEIDQNCNRTFHISKKISEGRSDKDIKEIVEPFFYTIISSYSVHAFISSNYNQDLLVFNRTTQFSDDPSNVCIDGYQKDRSNEDPIKDPSWINSIFYKNDGYVRSLVINPYRNKGNLNMNQENQIAKYRLASLLIDAQENNHKIFPDYDLDYIKFTFDPSFIEKKFSYCKDFNEIEIFLFNDKQDDVEKEKTELEIKLKSQITKDEQDKIEARIKELKKTIQYLKLSHSIFKKYCFGSEMSQCVKSAIMYLIYKIDKVVYGYNAFQLYRESKTSASGGRSLYEGNDHNLDAFFSEVRTNHSHSVSKIKQTLHFLDSIKYEDEEDKALLRDYLSSYNKSFFYSDYKERMGNMFSSLDQIIEELPPPFFQYEIFLKQKKAKSISWNQLSSGELQILHTLSTHAYHIRNLMSIDDSSIHYKNINLIFDELEICFHPEYQRQFVNRLVNMINLFVSSKEGFFFNIFLITHSPFVLSDIPQSNILFLKTEEDKDKELPKYTFAQNIGEMMYDSFFMEKTIGDFAEAKLKRIIKIKQGRNPDSRDEQYTDDEEGKNLQKTHKKEADAILNAIGDPVIRSLIEEVEKIEVSDDKN